MSKDTGYGKGRRMYGKMSVIEMLPHKKLLVVHVQEVADKLKAGIAPIDTCEIFEKVTIIFRLAVFIAARVPGHKPIDSCR